METRCRLLITFFFTTLLFQSIYIFAGEISPGQRAPEFNLRNIKGDLIRPFEDKKPIIVSFFFTECSTCRGSKLILGVRDKRVLILR